MEQQLKETITNAYRQNQILWGSLMAGVVMITTVITFITYTTPDFYDYNKFLSNPLMFIAFGLTVSCAFMANFILKKRLESTNHEGLSAKFEDFKSNFVLNAALHEGPAMISVVFMLLENNGFFIILILINLLLLFNARPTIEKFRNWYDLSAKESDDLNSLGLR